MLKVDSITCSNCDRLLCQVQYHENDNNLQVMCNCPYCGDSSFPLKINSDKCVPRAVNGLCIDDIDFDVNKKRVKIYACIKKV